MLQIDIMINYVNHILYPEPIKYQTAALDEECQISDTFDSKHCKSRKESHCSEALIRH